MVDLNARTVVRYTQISRDQAAAAGAAPFPASRNSLSPWLASASLALGDALAMLAAFVVVGWSSGAVARSPYQMAAAIDVGLFLACCLSAGLYNHLGSGPVERLRLRAMATAGFMLIKLCLSTLGAPWQIGLLALCAQAVIAFIAGYYGEAAIRAVLIRRGLWGIPTLIVGKDSRALAAAALLSHNPEHGLVPFAIADLESSDAASDASRTFGLSLRELRHQYDLESAIKTARCALISTPRDLELLKRAMPRGTEHLHLLLLDEFREAALMPSGVRMLAGQIALDLGAKTPQRGVQRMLKRMIDLVVVMPAALIALPIVGLLAVAVKLADKGPAIFRQHRVGEGDELVTIYKLRSMYNDAEARLERHLAEDHAARREWEKGFKLGRDPRIIPWVGDFIRRRSFDELPQLWNVIRGDMSLIGPRPFPPYHINKFDESFRRVRASVPPGLTGLWQVSARSDSDLAAQRAYDLYYVKNWSLWLDLYILLETVTAVLSARGAR